MHIHVSIYSCSAWAPGEVEKDLYNISKYGYNVLLNSHTPSGNNPQYSLTVNAPEQGGTTWILLSRHITTKV